MDNECKVQGIILSTKKLWGIKVNRKAFRIHPLDGATFPHLVKVKYKVEDKEYEKNKYIRTNYIKEDTDKEWSKKAGSLGSR